MPEIGGHDLVRDWQAAMHCVVRAATSSGGRSELTEQSITAIGQQADALNASAQAVEQAAELMKVQADLMAQTIQTLREPAELAKVAAGLERRPRKPR
jgi:hypothetical protein